MKSLVIAILMVPFLVCAQTKRQAKIERNYMKEYAFCVCLETYKVKHPTIADISKSIYTDLSDYTLSQQELVSKWVKQKVNQMPPPVIADYKGKRSFVFDCWNIYHHPGLDSLIRTFKLP